MQLTPCGNSKKYANNIVTEFVTDFMFLLESQNHTLFENGVFKGVRMLIRVKYLEIGNAEV